MDADTVIAIILAALTTIGLGITIPQALLNRIQKGMSIIDDLLIKMSAKDAKHKEMADALRARMDKIYSRIADGKITVLEAWDTLKDFKACYEIIKAYEPEKKMIDKLAELRLQLNSIMQEIDGVKVTIDPPKVN